MNKRVLISAIILLPIFASCSTTKPIVDNNVILKEHQAPYKVFSIGYWRPGYSILTLTDAHQEYFVIKTLNIDSLKIGNEYQPN